MERRISTTVAQGTVLSRSRWYLTKVKMIWIKRSKTTIFPMVWVSHTAVASRWRREASNCQQSHRIGLENGVRLSHVLFHSLYNRWPGEQPSQVLGDPFMRHELTPTTQQPNPHLGCLHSNKDLGEDSLVKDKSLWTGLNPKAPPTGVHSRVYPEDQIKSWKHGQSSTDSCPL